MGEFSEIYLAKKKVSEEEWQELIQIMNKYQGFLKKWQIIITYDNGLIRYFIETGNSLPATINGLSSFVFKKAEKLTLFKRGNRRYLNFKWSWNLVDFINEFEIKKKSTFDYLRINFYPLSQEKRVVKALIMTKECGKQKRYTLPFVLPEKILSVDFEGNKRFFYKSIPKYLEIKNLLPFISKKREFSLFTVDPFPYLNETCYLSATDFPLGRHSVIFGSSGSGKSKFISLLIEQIYQNPILREQYQIVLIDPHASLETDIGGLGRVIDFKDREESIDLFKSNEEDVIISTELMLELFKNLLAHQYNSKLERVLRHCIYLLLIEGTFNFSHLRKVLLDLEYRNEVIKRLKFKLPSSVLDFFLSDFNEIKTKSYSEAISPIIAFIDEMEMIPVFSKDDEEMPSLKEMIENNFFTLFSLDRVQLGDKVTKTISGFIMQQLFTIAQRRELTKHILFIIDEVAILENPILTRFLSEARKYNVSLILAGQYFNQITDDIKTAIFANVIHYFLFRLSKVDAHLFSEFLPMKIPLQDTVENKESMLTNLNNRECLIRIEHDGKLLSAFKGVTSDVKSFPRKAKKRGKVTVNVKPNDVKKKIFTFSKKIKMHDILRANSTSKKVNLDE